MLISPNVPNRILKPKKHTQTLANSAFWSLCGIPALAVNITEAHITTEVRLLSGHQVQLSGFTGGEERTRV